MKKESRNKLNKGVEFLKGLHFKPENIMVTGSIALDLMGLLPENREVNDVDFIVRMDNQSWRCLNLLEAICNDGITNDYPGERCLKFESNDLTVNIWKGKGTEFTDIKDSKTGVYVSTADNIIKAKKKYNRFKDLKDIKDIVKNIL